MAYSPQTFDTADVLRLEVEDNWPALPNLVPNPSGDFGGWGWTQTGVDEDGNLYTAVAPGVDPFTVLATTELMRIPGSGPGYVRAVADVVAARINGDEVPIGDVDATMQIAFYNDSRGYISTVSVAGVGHFDSGSAPIPSYFLIVVPIYATYFTVAIGVADNTAQGYERAISFRNVAATAQRGVAALPVPDVEPAYVDLIGAATEISIERTPADVGTLTAGLVADPDRPLGVPDADRAGLIRKGKRIRARSVVPEPDTGELESRYLFRGVISDHSTAYDVVTKPGRLLPRIQLAAVDPWSTLTGTARPEGADVVADLPALVLEGSGVPYDVDGVTSLNANPGTVYVRPFAVTVSQDATAADQIVITRDTRLAYAWLDARGVVMVRSALDDAQAASLDEDFYNGGGPTVSYALDDLVNSLTVRFRYLPSGPGGDDETSSELTFGPFEDADSIREYGGRIPKDVVIQGDPSDWLDAGDASIVTPALQAYATAVLAANAYTSRRITEVTAAITESAELLPGAKAHLELYDLVDAVSEQAGIASQPSRITRVSHSISPDKWLVTYGLAATDRVARHQRVRALAR